MEEKNSPCGTEKKKKELNQKAAEREREKERGWNRVKRRALASLIRSPRSLLSWATAHIRENSTYFLMEPGKNRDVWGETHSVWRGFTPLDPLSIPCLPSLYPIRSPCWIFSPFYCRITDTQRRERKRKRKQEIIDEMRGGGEKTVSFSPPVCRVPYSGTTYKHRDSIEILVIIMSLSRFCPSSLLLAWILE